MSTTIISLILFYFFFLPHGSVLTGIFYALFQLPQPLHNSLGSIGTTGGNLFLTLCLKCWSETRGNTNGTRNLISLSPYSSSLGVLSCFPFKTFQALAEGRAPQCQMLTNRSKGEQDVFRNNEFRFISPCTGFVRCIVVFGSKSKPKKKKKFCFAKSQLQTSFF